MPRLSPAGKTRWSRVVLLAGAALCALPALSAENSARQRPPYRLIYDNDLTNVISRPSPFHNQGEGFTIDKFRASVDEVAGTGVDAVALQPGYGWVPCWKSRIYPYARHVEWLKERYGTGPRFFGGYDAENVTGEFLDRCRAGRLAGFISLRMNDYHHKNFVDFTKEEFARYRDKINRKFELKVSKLYLDHPEYRLDDMPVPEQGNQDLFEYVEEYRDPIRINRLWNWAIPEVRQAKLDFIREIGEGYEFDGFELDFVRHPWLFKKDFPKEERVRIMTGFVRQVREVLDQTAKNGKRRWLSVRIPFRISDQEPLGVDVKAWYDAGVDIFNLAPEYRMEQQHDLAKLHEAVPEAPLYLEVTFTPYSMRSGKGKSGVERIMGTPEQYYTAAHLAYSRGATGLTVYNFAYYREFSEPPFEIFKVLRDPELVARQPQLYYLSDRDLEKRKFFQKFKGRFDRTFALDMAPPTGGWTTDGKLRIAMEPAFGARTCDVYFNGVALRRASDVESPYPTKQPIDPEKLAAWTVPRSAVRDGVNQVRIVLPDGDPGELIFLDIAIR